MAPALAPVLIAAATAQSPDLDYDAPFFPNSSYDSSISTPAAVLGFEVGSRPASHAEIERCIRIWSDESNRAITFEYARSFEGRSLSYTVITAPRHIDRIDEIRANLDRIGDPRGLSAGDGRRLLDDTPPVGWFAYSIHGDELSGSDAALSTMYHLCASTDDAVARLLDDVVLIFDPLMNPDGRDRCLQQITERRGAVPTVDDQATLHSGSWPWGRTNHYLFDLNRDWVLGVNPESRGRIRAAGQWNPVVFIDAHEMGGQDTYLFSPSREPLNPHLPESATQHWPIFARDQAAAFDRHGWRYYTGEWADEWYPGYTSSWSVYRGAVGILYEQAGVTTYGLARPEGRVLTYRESVHHQIVSTIANLATFHTHHDSLLADFLEGRRAAVSNDGPYAARTFAIVPTGNAGRLKVFLDLMRIEGFEIHVAAAAFSAQATDRLGRTGQQTFPAGTILIANRQPLAHLVAAMLEFDTQMSDAFLAQERREIIRRGSTMIYDITGWSLPMMHDVEAWELEIALPPDAQPFSPERPEISPGVDRDDALQAWVIDGADDRALSAGAALLEAGVEVRVADRPFEWDGQSFARGSLIVAREDNRELDTARSGPLAEVCARFGLIARGVDSGLGDGDIIDIGGEHFIRLEPPRVALLTRSPVSAYDAGSLWFTLDQRVGMNVSRLDAASLGRVDLRRYNVLIAPEGSGDVLGRANDQVEAWIRAGGTLIAIGSTASSLAQESGLSEAREISDALDDLDDYEIGVIRELAARQIEIDPQSVWSQTHAVAPEYPWTHDDFDTLDTDERERRDAWQRQFMPQGAILAARTDDEHWLTFGCGPYVPVMFADHPVLMTSDPVEAPVRFGVYELSDVAEGGERIGFVTTPPGHEFRMRMTGLLWPEAAQRIANGAWVTRERIGSGQVILFASPPTFRASMLGTERVFLNAVILGPGCGTNSPIRPLHAP